MSHQPMSLMTIDKNLKPPGNQQIEQDLLTLRILEASERKLQLIKKLVAPDEYETLAKDVFATNIQFDSEAFYKKQLKARLKDTKSVPISLEYGTGGFSTDKIDNIERLTRSETNLSKQTTDIQDTIKKRKVGDEFFFQEFDDSVENKSIDNLAIELRSGYYINPTEDQQLIKVNEFSLSDRLEGLAGWLGFSICASSKDEDEQNFLNRFKDLNTSPYNRVRNILMLKRRLVSDGQLEEFNLLDKIEAIEEDSIGKTEDFSRGIQTNTPNEIYSEKFILSIGHFNAIRRIESQSFESITKSHMNILMDSFLRESCKFQSDNKHKPINGIEIISNLCLKRKHPFDSNEVKLAKLLNCIDFGLLLGLCAPNMKELLSKRNYFSLDPFCDDFDEFQGDDVSLRHSLLVWRWLNKSKQIIYLKERENFQMSGIKCYKTEDESDDDENDIRNRLMDLLRSKPKCSGYKLIEQIRAQAYEILAQCESRFQSSFELANESSNLNQNSSHKLESLLREPQLQVDLWAGLRAARRLIPRPSTRRPLLPKRSDQSLRQSTPLTSTRSWSVSGARLVVTVQQATGVPFRRRQSSVRLSQPKAPTCYIEVIFQRRQKATSLAQGTRPAWNETLFFGVEPNSAGLVDEWLQLNLYDCRSYDLRSGQGKQLEPELENDSIGGPKALPPANQILSWSQRIERHLLGSLQLPLMGLLTSGRLEGSFTLNRPLLLDDYVFESELGPLEPIRKSSSGHTTGAPSAIPETRLALFVTLSPSPPPIETSAPLELVRLAVAGNQERVFEYALLWEQTLAELRRSVARSIQGSHVRALVLLANGGCCLASQFLAPIRPPEELIANKHPFESLSCFVSALVPLKYSLLIAGRQLASTIWFEPSYLVERLVGGLEERAILLCNYFLYLGCCSALLLVDTQDKGRYIYVIVWAEPLRFIEKDSPSDISIISNMMQTISVDQTNFISRLPIMINSSKSIRLWDPNLNKSFNVDDQPPPINIGSIITPENVYANIQANDSFASTNFDIRHKSCWFPLFERASNASIVSLANISLGHRSHTLGFNRSSLKRQLSHLESMRKSVGRPKMEPIFDKNIQLNYEKFTYEECYKLKEAIEHTLKAQLLKWRPNRPTYFNRLLSRLLGDKLATAAQSLLSGNSASGARPSDWRQELALTIKKEVLSSQLSLNKADSAGRKIISWPVNLSYTNMKNIVESLFAAGLHDADLILDNSLGSGAKRYSQYVVACHVEPLPARIMSVWLYVATIMNK